MTWATPLIASVAAAIAIPALLILYFLKLRRRNVDISCTLLWKKSIQDLQANAPFQRLRRNLLLFLQLLILAAMLAALGQPQLRAQAPIGQQHVIMIDRSASMSAGDGDGGVSRLGDARRRALRIVDSLREGGLLTREEADQAMVVAFDTIAEVRQQFTSDKRALRAAIESITPTDAPSRLEEAMKIAKAHLPKKQLFDATTNQVYVLEGLTSDSVMLHLISDGRLPDAAEVVTEQKDPLEYEMVGTPDAVNAGIVSLRAERAYDDPSQLSVFVGLQTTARAATPVSVSIDLAGEVSAVREVTVPAAAPPGPGLPAAPGTAGVVFIVERAEGALLTASIDPGPDDVLDVDDRAWLMIPPAQRLAVAVVTAGNLFLTTALEGLPLSKLDVYAPDDFARVLGSNRMGEYDVIVLDGWLPQDGTLPPGRFLVWNAVPSGEDGLVDEGGADLAVAIDWRRDHPVLRSVSLDNLWVGKSRRVRIPEGANARALASLDTGPAIIELLSAESHAIVVPFGVADSTWAFDVGFIVFVASAIGYLGEDASVGLGDTVRPGDTLRERVPLGAQSVHLRLPDGSRSELLPSADGSVAYGPVRDAGVYTISWDGEAGPRDQKIGSRVVRTIPANLLDPAESDVGAVGTIETASQVVAASARAEAGVIRRLWPWLLLAALAIVMLEWFIYNRKVYV